MKPAATPEEDLSGTARTGFAVTSSAQGIRFVTEFTTSVALARLLLPEDFGIVAVIASFLQVSYVVGNLGMGAGVVQARTLTRSDIDAASVISAAVGLLLTVVCGAISPLAAEFFHMDALRRAMPMMAIQITLAALGATPVALLRRQLRFKRTAVLDIVSSLTYATAGIGLAATGYGLWSLVWAPIMAGLVNVVLAHTLAAYMPRLRLDRDSARKLLGFGSTLTLKNILVNVGRNSDNLVVARMLGEVDTGLYARAFNLTTIPQTRFVSIVYGLSFPIFCRLRDDGERFRTLYAKASAAIAVVVAPILLGLCAMAPDFIVAVYGAQWEPMAPSVRILCVAGLVNCLHMLGGSAIEASGRLRYEVATESVYAALIPVGSFMLASFGIVGVSSAVLGAALVLYSLKAATLRAAIGLDVRCYLGASFPAMASALVMAAAVTSVFHTNTLSALRLTAGGTWIRLGVGAGVGILTYVAALFILGRSQLELVVRQAARLLQPWLGRRVAARAADAPSETHFS